MQATPENPLVGTQDRAALLQRLGKSLVNLSEIFGPEGRPGNIVGMSRSLLAYVQLTCV